MADEIQFGRATIQGIKNDGTAIDIDVYADTYSLQTVSIDHSFDEQSLSDNVGSTNTLIARNGKVDIQIDLIPYGATKAAAHAIPVFIAPLAKVIITHSKDAEFNGTYVYMGSGISLGNDKEGRFNVRLRRWTDSTQNTLLTTVAS